MTDPTGNSGPLGTTTNDPALDSGTLALQRNRSPGIWGADEVLSEDDRLYFGVADDSAAAAADSAAKFVIGVELKFRAGVHLYGDGTLAGSRSGEFTAAQVAQMSKGEKVENAEGHVPYNCTELPLDAVREYFRALGRPALGDELVGQARDARGRVKGRPNSAVESARLTALIRALHDRGGFETTYLAMGEFAPPGSGYREVARRRLYPTQAGAVIGADSADVVDDVRAPVDHLVLNGGTRQQRRLYAEFVGRLSGERFAIGTVSAGLHGFVIAAGQVYQVHWTADSTHWSDKDSGSNLIEVSSVHDFLAHWDTALVAIPAHA